MVDGADSGVRREGPFWDAIEGRAPAPPAARLLGWELVEVDPDAGTIAVAFTADERFLNPAGLVGHGRVVRRGGRIAHLAGELCNPDGTAVAGAVATALIRTDSA